MEDLGSDWKFGSCVSFCVLFLWLKGMDWLEPQENWPQIFGLLSMYSHDFVHTPGFLDQVAWERLFCWCISLIKIPCVSVEYPDLTSKLFGILCLTGLPPFSIPCIEKTVIGSDIAVLGLAWDVNQHWSHSINAIVWFSPTIFCNTFSQKFKILSKLSL